MIKQIKIGSTVLDQEPRRKMTILFVNLHFQNPQNKNNWWE